MMKTMKSRRLFALLGLFAVAACDEAGTDPLFDDVTAEEALELAVLEEPGSFEIAAEMTTTVNEIAASRGHAQAFHGRDLNDQARRRFVAAREALRDGERRRALDEAREARRLMARAILATGGAEALVALLERIEDLATTDGSDDDVFDDPEALRDQLNELAAIARDLLAAGDSIGAAERALLGEQLARHRRGRRDHRGDVAPDRARLAVAFAGTAVALAERIIASDAWPAPDPSVDNVSDRRNRWLAHAKRSLAMAERALASGHFARAVHWAHHAHWLSLKAVILPGGITEEELRAMAELANTLHEEAEEALGDDPTELELHLFERAGRLIDLGEEMLAEGKKRGVAPLWRAAVISRWLIG